MNIYESEGYKKLLAAVELDEKGRPNARDYRETLNWAVERAKHYAEVTGLDAADILDQWEQNRKYWYVGYYQDSNQPKLDPSKVKVFETQEELLLSIGRPEFRCPMCGGISSSPHECNSGKEMNKGKVCDWKVYGLFKDLGKGVYIFVKSELRGETIFCPVSWEEVPKDE